MNLLNMSDIKQRGEGAAALFLVGVPVYAVYRWTGSFFIGVPLGLLLAAVLAGVWTFLGKLADQWQWRDFDMEAYRRKQAETEH